MNKKIEELLNSEVQKTGKNTLKIDLDVLTNPNQGHWDLYKGENEDNYIIVEEDGKEIKLYGRNPKQDNGDVNYKNSSIAIDFGTKSTTIGMLDEKNKFQPLRLGGFGDSESIENPTILCLQNYKSFIEEYISKDSRPKTNFSDLESSHYAEALKNNVNSPNYTPLKFFNNLKQWTNKKSKFFRKDSEDNLVLIPEITSNDYKKASNAVITSQISEKNEYILNPIEIYAYTIGNIVNTMGEVIPRWVDTYYMSYPASTKLGIRKLISESFRLGLKKTMPANDIDVRIRALTNEPTAYTISVIDQLNIYEKNREKGIFYATFDFGGGTSDYAYGIVNEGMYRGNETIFLNNLFTYGDRYLGGENLILKLVYDFITYGNNPKEFEKNNVKFYKYTNLDYEFRARDDKLFAETHEAVMNTNELINNFRPLWENYNDLLENVMFSENEYYNDLYECKNDGKFDFYCEGTGSHVKELDFDFDMLSEELEKNIKIGVLNFINGLKIALEETIETEKGSLKVTKEMPKYIILGGNSSKSKYFRMILEKELENEGFITSSFGDDNDGYNIIPPLDINNPELVNYYKEDYINAKDKESLPTGKTGVVYGILKLQQQKYVVRGLKPSNEIPFLYNIISNKIQDNKKSLINFKIKSIVKVDNKIKELKSSWIKYREDIDYYTTQTEFLYTNYQYLDKPDKNIKIGDGKRRVINLDIDEEDEDALYALYLRVIDPETIEYRIVSSDDQSPSDNDEIDYNKTIILN